MNWYRPQGIGIDLGIDGCATRAGHSSGHNNGQAWDWGVVATGNTPGVPDGGAEEAAAYEVINWLIGPDEYGNPYGAARRLGIMYIIFDERIWSVTAGPYAPRFASGHRDHVHFSLSNAGAQKQTSGYTEMFMGPDAQSHSVGAEDVFFRAADNSLHDRYWVAGSPWLEAGFGGVLTAGVSASSWGTGRGDVFVRGTDNALYHKWLENSGWLPAGSFEYLGAPAGGMTSGPGSSSWASTFCGSSYRRTRLDVFSRGANNAVYRKPYIRYPVGSGCGYGGGWGSWSSLGGVATSDPASVTLGPNDADVFVRGADGALWMRSQRAGVWGSWSTLGGIIVGGPDVVVDSRFTDVVARGADNRLWWIYRRPAGTWSSWQALDGILTSDPTAVTRDGVNYNVYARGGDGQLYQKTYAAASGWGGWSPIGGRSF